MLRVGGGVAGEGEPLVKILGGAKGRVEMEFEAREIWCRWGFKRELMVGCGR
jgi:hypothetical protein